MTGWWFQIFLELSSLFGEEEPILTHIFPRGSFNHQLDDNFLPVVCCVASETGRGVCLCTLLFSDFTTCGATSGLPVTWMLRLLGKTLRLIKGVD